MGLMMKLMVQEVIKTLSEVTRNIMRNCGTSTAKKGYDCHRNSMNPIFMVEKHKRGLLLFSNFNLVSISVLLFMIKGVANNGSIFNC